MELYIDTKDRKTVKVVLKKNGENVDQMVEDNEFGSQILLGLIRRLLESNGVKYQDLDMIEVNTGPGSFTGLKVGVAVANALAFSLQIPVNGKNAETEIIYE